jgi:hypothetical protein
MINKDKVIQAIDKCILIANEADLSEKEIVLFFAQFLIAAGKSIYDPENNLGDKLNWVELNRKYYSDDKSNIGLGLLLNGGQMMTVIDEKIV